ncbi:guanine nucleotide-binding protein-like 3 homolog [Mizuhopecten yessoensis]|uniref:Guanine nucleotide-binding protein-like 3-like n=1 Tax=Mizuhopecten yessoensis TaxID=6573 RepID=A0A210PEY0_MIZYE|nr:guanine nucleotide-binding protein-like 3 homolog [Mizuhopecten yessoensis]OWF35042.1 Guanine nucleotide-binding protein-like 3-like [Mizuhopecten yessoensis]
MANLYMRKASKRVSAKTRYKVEKKVRQHKKKVKKLERKNGSKKMKKDPGIPNSLPFKESVLKEAQERKQRLEEEQEKKKQKRKKDRARNLAKKRNLEGMLKDAQKRGGEFEKKKTVTEDNGKASGKAVETSLKAFYKEFRKVVDVADVVLEVLDARDPLGSRCAEMEEAIISSGANKRLVLVLNKIDLVPRENVEAWLTHLRNEFPTVAFKASTQTQAENLSQKKVTSLATVSGDLLKSSHCIGADILMKLLGNYCRSRDIKTAIRVGVVGFPNTGKSSIINSLKRCKACNVGSQPGITRAMQEVHLDKYINLLDSPGVVMATGASDMSVILRNCVKLESLADPVGPVEAILKRCSKEQLMIHYRVPDYSNVNDFLALLAKRFGKLKKGGIPDVGKAAKTVLHDWTCGRITYYTQPPEQHTLPTHISAEFVTKMGKEFCLDDLLSQEQKNLQGLETRSHKHMLVDSLGAAKVIMSESDLEALDTKIDSEEEEEEDYEFDDDEDEENMEGSDLEKDEEEDEDDMMNQMTVSIDAKKKGGRTPKKGQGSVEMKTVGGSAEKHKLKVKAKRSKGDRKAAQEKLNNGLLQLNKQRKQDFKKMKKQRKRADKVAGDLSTAMTEAFSIGMD